MTVPQVPDSCTQVWRPISGKGFMVKLVGECEFEFMRPGYYKVDLGSGTMSQTDKNVRVMSDPFIYVLPGDVIGWQREEAGPGEKAWGSVAYDVAQQSNRRTDEGGVVPKEGAPKERSSKRIYIGTGSVCGIAGERGTMGENVGNTAGCVAGLSYRSVTSRSTKGEG